MSTLPQSTGMGSKTNFAVRSPRRLQTLMVTTRLAAMLTTLMLVFSVAQLILFVREGKDSPDKSGDDPME
jgi:hypothetical protein